MTNNIHELENYMNEHPEKRELILALEQKRKHLHGSISHIQTKCETTVTLIKEIKHDAPRIMLNMFSGEPVYTVWGDGKMIYIPIDSITITHIEEKEFDNSENREIFFNYFYDEMIHALVINYC